MPKEIKVPGPKRYSLSADEREEINMLNQFMLQHKIESDALFDSIQVKLAKVKQRLGLNDLEVPEGYELRIDFDILSYDYVVKFEKKSEVTPVASN